MTSLKRKKHANKIQDLCLNEYFRVHSNISKRSKQANKSFSSACIISITAVFLMLKLSSADIRVAEILRHWNIEMKWVSTALNYIHFTDYCLFCNKLGFFASCCIRVSKACHHLGAAWNLTYEQIFTLSRRVWTVVKTIII